MPKRVPFVHKLLTRIDRLDRASVESHFTDLIQELNLLEEVLEEISEGVILIDEEGRVLFMNRQAASWTGFHKDSAGKRRLSEIVKDAGLARLIQSRIPSLREKVVADIKLLTPKEIPLRVTFSPLSHAGKGALILLSATPFDIPGGDNRLARVEALVSLAAGIAHEIGNPLNSISIHLQLLKKEAAWVPETRRKSFEKTLEVLNSETARLDRIIKNFLKATRKPPLRFRQDSLNEIAEAALEFMRPELSQRKITVQFSADSSLPLFLMDRERLHQVFINLIKNAMEAMPGGGKLSIKILRRDNVAVLSFKDEGSGIPEADLPHIFEAYYTTKEEGSGLGLLTVFNAVREHGGQIEVASKVGKGTTFTLLIPVRQPKLQLPGEKNK